MDTRAVRRTGARKNGAEAEAAAGTARYTGQADAIARAQSTLEPIKLDSSAGVCLPRFLALGLISNGWMIWRYSGLEGVDTWVHRRTLLFLGVSAFRCAFPNRYKGWVVLHDTPLSSIFLTRCLATLSELAWIYQLSHVLWSLNAAVRPTVAWIDTAATAMFVLACIAQLCVWLAILLDRARIMFWEELCWAGIFVINTMASAALLPRVGAMGPSLASRKRAPSTPPAC